MGVYVFKFLGDSGDGSTWCKVGFHGTLDPWRRLCGSKVDNMWLPTEQMRNRMCSPEEFELLYWWPNLDLKAEQKIHLEFTRVRRGEWYREQDIAQVVEYVGQSFANCEMTLTLTIPARYPYTEEELKKHKASKAKRARAEKEYPWNPPPDEWKKNKGPYKRQVRWRRYAGEEGKRSVQTFMDFVEFTVEHRGLFDWLATVAGFMPQKNNRLRTNVHSPLLTEWIVSIQRVPMDDAEQHRDLVRQVVEQLQVCLCQSMLRRRETISYIWATTEQVHGHMYAFAPTMVISLATHETLLRECNFNAYDGEWFMQDCRESEVLRRRQEVMEHLHQVVEPLNVDAVVSQILNTE